MSLTHKEIQLHYDGFLKTPFLWNKNIIQDLYQFEIETKNSTINLTVSAKIRLGKYIERFVSFQLAQEQNIQLLAENIQIQQNKRTLGELDCILKQNHQPIHLEIIYKFYLYDASVGNSEIEHFIGPNRKDALQEKINKLKNKQLPLLFSNFCKPYLDALELVPEKMKQQVYFKAQLFVPFDYQKLTLQHLNQDCIVGIYINHHQLNNFKSCKFYIPSKKDWLIIPHTHVAWMTFKHLKVVVSLYLQKKYSTLLWVKNKNGTIEKVFIVWW